MSLSSLVAIGIGFWLLSAQSKALAGDICIEVSLVTGEDIQQYQR